MKLGTAGHHRPGSIVLATALAACGSSEKTVDQAPAAGASGAAAAGSLVGVAMPTKTVRALDRRRRQRQGSSSRSSGYKVDLQYAENDIPTQVTPDREP